MITAFKNLPPLIKKPVISTVPADTRVERTGLPRLDALLPHDGWPVGAVIEMQPTHADIGAFSILVPTVARLTQAGRKVALMDSAQKPDLEALGDEGVRLRQVEVMHAQDQHALWAMEHKLRSGEVALLVAWTDALSDRHVRRLKAAAEAGGSIAVLFRSAGARSFSTESALRLSLRPGIDGLLDVEVLYPRGSRSGHVVAHGRRPSPRRVVRPQAPLSATYAYAGLHA